MFLVVRNELKSKITNISSEIVRTGLKNTYGNKGYILSRFKLNDTNVAVCSAHLHGKSCEKEKRFEELSSILSSKCHEKSNKSFCDNDAFFIIGDLNFKVNVQASEIKQIINEKNYSRLAKIDEFLIFNETSDRKQLKDAVEGSILFNPTFKFINKTKEYDMKKAPSW